MKTIINNETNPYFNLAFEEYVLKNIYMGEDILLLWQNEPSIIIGRNQNIFEEVNIDFVTKHKIPVLRRISGGGTVFHDLGNINYTYIVPAKGNINNYQLVTQKLVDCLNHLGFPVYFHGKSDLYIDDKKVSGNAQFVFKQHLLHHGTLLFDTNLSKLNGALKDKDNRFQSISVKSNRSTVTNLNQHTNLDIHTFKSTLLKCLLKIDNLNDALITLTTQDLIEIQNLAHQKYETWDWNYGESPSSIWKKQAFGYDLYLEVNAGLIHQIEIKKNGQTLEHLQEKLLHKRLMPAVLLPYLIDEPKLFDLIFNL